MGLVLCRCGISVVVGLVLCCCVLGLVLLCCENSVVLLCFGVSVEKCLML